ncbi:MAG: hypothetical protein JNL52_01090 [Flavobacteriales bacterium]|nr:hypothetical protein [Flavobacteriales bacterium]
MPMVEDLSPMKVGSVGRFRGEHFRITGRVRVESDRGYRNFWSIKGDLAYQWIAQCFGNYALLSEWKGDLPMSDLRGLRPSGKLRLKEGDAYHVEMLSSRFRYAFEGVLMHELRVPYDVEVEVGRPPDGKALLLIEGAKRVSVLSGITVDHADLRLENIPSVAQWT